MVVAKEWRVKRTVSDGTPTMADFDLVEVDLGDNLEDGEILVKTNFVSVDPVVRLVMKSLQAGDVVANDQVGVVTSSKNPDFPVGAVVVSHIGWVDHYKVNPKKVKDPPEVVNPKLASLVPQSMLVGM